MATIRKRSWTTPKGEHREAWRVRYVDNDGNDRTRQFDKKRDADAFRIKAESEVAAGVHTPDLLSVTVAEAADLWTAKAINGGRERSTVKQYQEWANLHIKPLIGSEKLSRLTMPKIEAFKDALLETRSPAMAGKVVRGLSSIITDAQRRGLVAQNVAKGVKVVRSSRDKKNIVIPSRDDVKALLAAARVGEADQPALYPMLLTVAFTGLRSSELRGLRKVDVDLKRQELHVAQRADQWGVIGSPKSEAGTRTIPIPPALVTELRKWMLRSPHSEAGLLFPNGSGGPRLHSNLLNREYRPVQVAAGLTGDSGKKDEDGKLIPRARYDFHALRHYAASAWIKQKVDLKRLTTWLGHASVQMTLDTYGHLIKDEQGDAAIAAATAAELMG
jgi:integrase